MQDHLRDRILRKLETLSDERGYQVLDFVEFLESRYAERTSTVASAFTRFTETIEDGLRAGKVSTSTIVETVGFMNRAANVLSNALNASKAAANEIVSGATRPAPPSAGASSGSQETPAAPKTSSPAGQTQAPGAPGEKL
jgi:hypothetical protein